MTDSATAPTPIGGSARLLAALRFAAEHHRGQRRKDAERSPYVNHVIAVAELLARVGGVTDEDTLVSAVLHDTVEDTAATAEDIEREFGPRVRALVAEVTDDKRLPAAERKRLQIEHASRASEGAKLIKLADKICNVRDITHAPPAEWSLERRRDYLAWSAAVVAGCRGASAVLGAEFDQLYAAGLAAMLTAPSPTPAAPPAAAPVTPSATPAAPPRAASMPPSAAPIAPPFSRPSTPADPPRKRFAPTPRMNAAVPMTRGVPAPPPSTVAPVAPPRPPATPAPPAAASAPTVATPPAAVAQPAPAATSTPAAPVAAVAGSATRATPTGSRPVALHKCAGIDGCASGWVVASIGEGGALDVAVVPDFARIVRQVRGGQFDHVVVDMPIGLPDTESRKADQEARRLLRARASCVSPAPRRPMLNAKSHDEANRIRERLDGKRISKQGYLLLPKIYEVDELIDSTSQRVIREGHPEVTFCVLNDDTPIAEPKETPEGRSIRVALLGRAFASLGVAFDELPTKPRGASTDDVIDALAMLVSAVRAARGQSRTLPARPEYDERGLRAEMVA